jgi:methionyl-tRNA formyltransferase
MRKRIVYLSSGQTGIELLAWLRSLPCDVVWAETANKRVEVLPPYDLGLCFLYTHRIPANELIADHAWINFHSGPLPEMRGRDLCYHAIRENRESFGATAHYMEPDYDTGPIIECRRFHIGPSDTAGDLVRRSHAELVRLFKKHVPNALVSRLPADPQGPGRYYRKEVLQEEVPLTEDQGRAIRALTVHPRFHAFVRIGGRRYSIVPVGEDEDA